MPKERTLETEIGGYMSTLLRNHFGKGPTSVYVTIARPFITIHFKGFVNPIEKNLLKQNEWKRVLETRDLLLNDLKPQILEALLQLTNMKFAEVYADWNLDSETGLLLGTMSESSEKEKLAWSGKLNQERFHQKIEQVHEEAQRKPGRIESYWLSNRTLLVKRVDILVGIEKALIAEGFTEILKLAKRPLERTLLQKVGLEEVLNRNIQETFLDWNFDQDVGYAIFILEPGSPSQI